MCYVHDSYIRHVQLKMTNYIYSAYYHATQSHLPMPLSDPGDSQVDHGHESQGVAMVLCSATMNKLRTPHGAIHLSDLDILLEPTIFGMAISGAIPDHLRAIAHQVSVSCTVPQIV